MRNIKGKVAIITGSSRGIGKHLAIEMAERGAKVVINGRNEKRLKETFQYLKNKNLESIAVTGDVSNFIDCENLIRQAIRSYGKIDILVNNAALASEGEVEKNSPELIKKIVDVNYLGSIYPTILAIPHIKAEQGSILFISSIAGLHGLPNNSIYSSTKMALTALVESLKVEMAGTGVHVGIAYLGFTKNDPGKTIYNADGKLELIPKRKEMVAQPVEKVVNRLIKIIQKRTYKSTFSFLGKLLLFLKRFCPWIVDRIFMYSYRIRKNQKK